MKDNDKIDIYQMNVIYNYNEFLHLLINLIHLRVNQLDIGHVSLIFIIIGSIVIFYHMIYL
jgi:hypothetical protein